VAINLIVVIPNLRRKRLKIQKNCKKTK